MNLLTLGVDFERSFFNQVTNHLSEAKLIGCLFHFKKGNQEENDQIGMPDKEVSFAINKGVIDLFTVIPKEELNTKGVNFFPSMIYNFCGTLFGVGTAAYKTSKDRCDLFWGDYFLV